MTLEFENPPLLSNIGLNSSYNETDFTPLDRVTSKKTSVISVTRKESLLARGKLQENREMSGRYSDDYDSYEDDFDSPSTTKEPTARRLSSRRKSRMSERVRSTSRSPSESPPKQRSRSKKASSRRDSFASYRSAYGTNRGKFPFDFFVA